MASSTTYTINVKSKGVKKANRDVKKLKSSMGGLNKAITGLVIGFGAYKLGGAIIGLGKSSIKTAGEFETLRIRLNNMYGSVQKGGQAFDAFNEIAATTPFQLKNVVEAGASLKAFGVDAENMIKPVADLAAFMGVNATEAAQAFGRAFAGGAGAADILRERGVLELVKSFSKVKDLTKLTLPEFRKALISTMQDPMAGIAGQTEQLSKTFEGSFSNMQDSLSRLSAEIGNTLSPSIQNLMKKISGAADALTDFLETPDKFKEGAIQFEKRQDKLSKLTLPELESKLKAARLELDNYTKATLETAEKTNLTSGSIDLLGGSFGKTDKPLQDGIITIGEVNSQNEELVKILRDNGVEFNLINDIVEDVSKAYDLNVSSMKVVNDEMARLTGEVTDLETALEREKNRLADLPHFFKENQEEIQKTVDKISLYVNAINGVANAYNVQRQATLDADKANALAATNGIRSERLRQREIDKINKVYDKKQKELNKESQKIKRAQTVVNTSVAVMEALSAEKPGFPGNFFVAALVAAQGAMQLKAIDAAKYEQGGLVGGRRHSQGGTMIEAERGEYVVSRRGVDAAGLEALNRFNAGQGAGGINISINNPVLSKDVVEDDLIPQIKEAIRRGADIGVG